MEFWKSFISLKESYKPSGRYVRVWSKNQLRFEMFEKTFKFTYKNLNGNLIFYPFSLPYSRAFVILYTAATYQNLEGESGGGCINPCYSLMDFLDFREVRQMKSPDCVSVISLQRCSAPRKFPVVNSPTNTDFFLASTSWLSSIPAYGSALLNSPSCGSYPVFKL